ncbi:MAG: hypothetical protein Q4G13_02610 [Moraxella sp.]|nr:hypothetical protein [Moraxella sp.]
MSQIIINLDDGFASEIFAYTAEHKTSFEEATKKLWQDFLSKKNHAADDGFLTVLEKTKNTWQHGDGLAYQQQLRKEWD